MAATVYAGLTIRAPLPASGGAGCAKTRRPASPRRPPLWSLRGELFEQPRQIVQPANDLAHALVFGHFDFPLSPSPRDAARADTLGASAPVESCRQYPTGFLKGYFTTRIRLRGSSRNRVRPASCCLASVIASPPLLRRPRAGPHGQPSSSVNRAWRLVASPPDRKGVAWRRRARRATCRK
jgi:hypothetical protein